MTNSQPIQAMIFDLDGTLVQTEKLKAQSYAKAAALLCPHDLAEETVIEAFKDVVGLSRKAVAMSLVEQFNLAEKAQGRQAEFGVSRPWQAYVQLRLQIYEEMLGETAVIQNNQWPHNIALLRTAEKAKCKIALATMSHCEQANRVLSILGLQNSFDFIATRDDVASGKPHPEIYNLVTDELELDPRRTLVIEDSPAGVQAALNANMHVIAVSTPFTKQRLVEASLLPAKFMVHDSSLVLPTVERYIKNHLS